MKVIINENNVKGILLKLWEKKPYLDPTCKDGDYII